MNDFIVEKNNFISKDDADHILNLIIQSELPFEKNSYNIHGENYEHHNLQHHPLFKQIVHNKCLMVEKEISEYFGAYNVQTFKQEFLSASILYLKKGAMIPRHTDDQYDRGVLRSIGILLYLNTPFAGGELAFPLQKKAIRPEAGKLVIFPSVFTHPHLVMAPTEDRYALRFNYGMQAHE